jgi:hypothetical protein
MRLKRTLPVVALVLIIAVSFSIYALAASKSAWPENNQEKPSDMTNFKAVVNGMRNVDVLVHVDISDGLTEEEAKQITEATFIQVMGQNVMRQLDTLTLSDTQIKAHYFWGYNENDIGHVFYMDANLTTLQITVSHCF